MVTTTVAFNPPILRGLIIHPENPLRFDFIVDKGDGNNSVGNGHARSLQEEYTRLIKYFLATLTIPEDDLWVNLSPYEKERIIPNEFGQTEMGRDLLAQDYILKQLMASLTYPESGLGKKFWDEVYKKAYEQYGTTNIPLNTFNKVWIVPDKAVVYENKDKAFIVESHLKVMLEEDYLALSQNMKNEKLGTTKQKEEDVKAISSDDWNRVKEYIKKNKEGEVFAPEPRSSYLEGDFLGHYAARYYGRAGSLLIRLYGTRHDELNFAQMELATAILRNIFQEYEIIGSKFDLEEKIVDYVKGQPIPYGITYAELEPLEKSSTQALIQ